MKHRQVAREHRLVRQVGARVGARVAAALPAGCLPALPAKAEEPDGLLLARRDAVGRGVGSLARVAGGTRARARGERLERGGGGGGSRRRLAGLPLEEHSLRLCARVRRLREFLRELLHLLHRQALLLALLLVAAAAAAAGLATPTSVDGGGEALARTPPDLNAAAAAAAALEPVNLRAQLPPLLLQGVDHALVLGDVRLHGAPVLVDVGLDLLGPIRVFERVHRVLVLVRAARDGRHHDRPAVPAQPILQDSRQLTVAERHEDEALLLALTERVDAVGEGQQRTVDVGAVPELMPAVVRLRRALRASQVHQRQLPRRVRLAVVVALRPRHPNLEHGMRPRGNGVGASLLCLSTRVALTQQLKDGVLVVDGDVGQAADHGAAFGILPQLQRGRVGHEQVVHELVVHLGVGALHLVIFLPAVARDEAKDVAKREHHEPRIPLIPHHGVRLTAARGAVREHRGVRSPEHSRDVR